MTLETDEINLAGYGLPGKIQEETKETIPGKPSFWIFKEPIPNPEEFVGKARGFHVAFPASSPEMIQAWYQKCLESGAQDNGAPGPRRYHPGYYAAFVVDPNGYRIEAVLHDYKDKTVSA